MTIGIVNLIESALNCLRFNIFSRFFADLRDSLSLLKSSFNFSFSRTKNFMQYFFFRFKFFSEALFCEMNH